MATATAEGPKAVTRPAPGELTAQVHIEDRIVLAPGDDGKMYACKQTLTPIEAVNPLELFPNPSLIFSKRETRPMIEGIPNQIDTFVYKDSSGTRVIFLTNYVPWNMVLDAKFDPDKSEVVFLQNGNRPEGTQESQEYWRESSANFRVICHAKDFGCKYWLTMIHSRDAVPLHKQNRQHQGAHPIKVHLALVTDDLKLKRPPFNNTYDDGSICIHADNAAMCVDSPDGVFGDFENCPGNHHLNKPPNNTPVGYINRAFYKDNPELAKSPYITMTMPKADQKHMQNVALSLPNLWDVLATH